MKNLLRPLSPLFGSAWLLLAGSGAQAKPFIVANPNPVVLSPGGATVGNTNLMWDADNSKIKNAQIYEQEGDGAEILLAGGSKGNTSVPIALGKSYTFRLYQDATKRRLLASEKVVAQVQGRSNGPTAPSVPTVPTGIGNVVVRPSSHNVVITFDAPPNQIPIVEIGKSPARRGADGLLGLYDNAVGGYPTGGFPLASGKAGGHYKIDISVINQLAPNTGYYYLINAVDANRKRLQTPGQFTTRGQKVTIVWDNVHVSNDSDPLGSGELRFWLWANYGQPGGQVVEDPGGPTRTLDLSSGDTHQFGKSVTIENAPDSLLLEASGSDNDNFGTPFSGDIYGTPSPIQRPEATVDKEVNVARQLFDLSIYGGDSATVPFTLHSMDADGGKTGDLRFEVSGRILINREQLGTVSTPLETAPIWETTPIAPPDPGLYATFLYGLQSDGTLVWWRHDGAAFGTDKWQGPRRVGVGWNFKKIIPGGGNVIYGITNDGKLMWLQHRDFNTGDGLSVLRGNRIQITPRNGNTGIAGNNALGGAPQSGGNEILVPNGGGGNIAGGHRRPGIIPNAFHPRQNSGHFLAIQGPDPNPRPFHSPLTSQGSLGIFGANSQGWKGPVQIGTGWDQYKQVFSGGDGVIYAVTRDNTLLWFKHDNYLSADGPGALEGPKVIAHDWKLNHTFSCGDGVIYGIGGLGDADGLYRYKNLGASDGTQNWMQFGATDYQEVNKGGWDKYGDVFSAGVISTGTPQELRGPVIYGIDKDGQLWWRVQIRLDANGLGRNWLGPKQMTHQWQQYKQVIALIPANLPAGGGVH